MRDAAAGGFLVFLGASSSTDEVRIIESLIVTHVRVRFYFIFFVQDTDNETTYVRFGCAIQKVRDINLFSNFCSSFEHCAVQCDSSFFFAFFVYY